MIIKRFKNGNYNVRRDAGENENLIVALCNSAELDFYFPEGEKGEPFCLGNAIGMAQDLYNANTGKVYMITDQDQQKWKRHFVVHLVGRKEE